MRAFAYSCALPLFQPPIVCRAPLLQEHPSRHGTARVSTIWRCASSQPNPASALPPRSCLAVSGRSCSLEQVSHSGQQVVAICADKKIRLCELGREGGLLPRAGRTRHPLLGKCHQKLPRDCRGAAPGVPLMLTAQEHVIDELDSITSLSLSRDSRCAKLLSECSRTARHAQASTTRELRLSMSCACAHRTCACVHTLASSALIGF